MIVDDVGNLYTWGSNINGELGFDDKYPREWLT
jgi:alpha-tubulin suppressor-like RCC1 family protein